MIKHMNACLFRTGVHFFLGYPILDFFHFNIGQLELFGREFFRNFFTLILRGSATGFLHFNIEIFTL